MNKLVFFLLIVFCNPAKSQSIIETVSYINTLLKASTYTLKLQGTPSPYENVFDTISVDVHGKIECVRLLTDTKTGKAENKFRFYAYLKALKSGHKTDYSEYYITTLDCIGSQLCFGGIGVERTDVYFSITTISNRDKLHNAFLHLLELAKSNKEFYNKDPFGN
jgi:hypothetical protein